MISLRLPPEVDERLEALARMTGRSKAFYAREAIIEYLDDLEDTDLAQEALEEHIGSGSRTVSMKELSLRHG